MPQDIKQQIITELDQRIASLKAHRFDEVIVSGNQYQELNQALAKVIGVPLTKELEDVKAFVMGL